MSTPKGSSTPKPISRPTEPDPSALLDQLSLDPSSASAQAIPTPLPSAPHSGTSLASQSSELKRQELDSAQKSRVHALELAEQGDWIPLLPSLLPFASFAKVAGLGRGLDPKVLVGKVLDLGGDRGPIRRRSRREIECAEGEGRWEVVLEGFHHLTDEEDALDPLTSASLTTLRSSSRWDSLFDPDSPYTPESPVIVEDAAYGIPSSLLSSSVRDELSKAVGAPIDGPNDKLAPEVDGQSGKGVSKEAREAVEECAKRGAVGFGIRWSHPGRVGEGESLWGWIWGEDPSGSAEEYDEDEGEDGEGGADGDDGATTYKAVHFVKADEEDGSTFDAQGGEGAGEDGDEGLVNDGADLGDL